MSSLNLNSTVRIVSKTGAQQRTSIREVIKLGSGKAYEGIIMLDEWPSLLAAYQAELAEPLVSMNERIRIACKESQKAHWWAQKGLYENARAANRTPTAADAMEAGAEFKEAEKKLVKLLQEEYDLFQQGHQIPVVAVATPMPEPVAAVVEEPAPALAAITEQQSGIYLNTRSRSIWL
jgi:hypothetical protein